MAVIVKTLPSLIESDYWVSRSKCRHCGALNDFKVGKTKTYDQFEELVMDRYFPQHTCNCLNCGAMTVMDLVAYTLAD